MNRTLSFLMMAAALPAIAHAEQSKLTKIDQGWVEGSYVDDTVVFKGIPYAAPPVGPLRWHAPAPALPWKANFVFSAQKSGPTCIQPKEQTDHPKIEGSEDCLTLNVWAPRHPAPSTGPLPVMVFIHGGFFLQGDKVEGADLVNVYDGRHLSERGEAIVITINYRLGILGFMGHPALSAESGRGVSGNYGTLDQIAALQWVQKNVAAFGGDPSKVTIFGESAGAASVLVLTASPLARGLFRAAIVESGYLVNHTLAAAEGVGKRVSQNVGCDPALNGADELACLRSKTASAIAGSISSTQTEGKAVPLLPNVDGYVLPDSMLHIYEKGQQNPVPMILGTNANESATLVGALYGKPVTDDAGMEALVVGKSGRRFWDAVSPHYNSSVYGTAQQAVIQLSSDVIFTCPTRRLMRALSRNHRAPVWRYVFSHVSNSPFLHKYAAGHGLELPYIFNFTPQVPYPTFFPNLGVKFLGFTPGERVLAESMQDRWIRFAKDLNPGWTEFSGANAETYVNFDDLISEGQDFRPEGCDALDSVAQ